MYEISAKKEVQKLLGGVSFAKYKLARKKYKRKKYKKTKFQKFKEFLNPCLSKDDEKKSYFNKMKLNFERNANFYPICFVVLFFFIVFVFLVIQNLQIDQSRSFENESFQSNFSEEEKNLKLTDTKNPGNFVKNEKQKIEIPEENKNLQQKQKFEKISEKQKRENIYKKEKFEKIYEKQKRENTYKKEKFEKIYEKQKRENYYEKKGHPVCDTIFHMVEMVHDIFTEANIDYAFIGGSALHVVRQEDCPTDWDADIMVTNPDEAFAVLKNAFKDVNNLEVMSNQEAIENQNIEEKFFAWPEWQWRINDPWFRSKSEEGPFRIFPKHESEDKRCAAPMIDFFTEHAGIEVDSEDCEWRGKKFRCLKSNLEYVKREYPDWKTVTAKPAALWVDCIPKMKKFCMVEKKSKIKPAFPQSF